MADDIDGDPDNVLPFIARAPAGNRPRPTGDGRVAQLGIEEPAAPWRGDEEWISTLPDPHDTTKAGDPE